VPLVAKSSQLGFQAFALASLGTATMIFQNANDAFDAIILLFEQYFQTLKLSFATGGAFAPSNVTASSAHRRGKKSTISTLD